MSLDPAILSVATLVRERDAALREVEQLRNTDREARIVTAAYRRGYQAGRMSMYRGHEPINNPERNARGWVRELVRA